MQLGATPAASQLVNLPVGAQIGNEANVKVQFLFHGEYYVWMIDDVEVASAPNNDLRLDSAEVLSMVIRNNVLFYPIIPEFQNFNNRYNYIFRAMLTNNGAVIQPNVRLNVKIIGLTNGTVVYNQNSSAINLAPGTDHIALLSTSFNLLGNIENYNIVFTPVSDSSLINLNDDTTRINFRVSDSTYAIDNGILYRAIRFHLSITFGTGGTVRMKDETFLANDFRIVEKSLLTSVFIRTINTSRLGTIYRVLFMDTSSLRETSAQGFPSKILIRSHFRQYTAQDSVLQSVLVSISEFYDDNGILIPQDNVLNPNRYLIGVQYFNILGNDTVIFGTFEDQTIVRNNDSLPFVASCVFNPNFPTGNEWIAGLSGRFFNGWVIRPQIQRMVSVKKQTNLKSFNLYPNPNKGSFNVEFSLNNSTNVELIVRDITGKAVYCESKANVLLGMFTQNINLGSGIAQGMYILEINTNLGKSVSKLVIN